MLAHGLSTLPAGISAVLISRSQPSPPFVSFSVGSSLTSITWDELRFTEKESRAVLELSARKNISDDILSELYTTTQGWAAGLVLLAQQMRHQEVRPEALGHLTREEIFSYFARELFEKAGTEVQKFLLTASFLPRMTIQMAEQFTGMKASRILSQLARDHYFTFRHMQPEPVYLFHPLFRMFLLTKCRELLTKEDFAILYVRAGELLEKAGQIEDAASIYIETGHTAGLTRLITTNAPTLMKQGRIGTVRTWLQNLPQDAVEHFPGYCTGPVSAGSLSAILTAAPFSTRRSGCLQQPATPGALLSPGPAPSTLLFTSSGT